MKNKNVIAIIIKRGEEIRILWDNEKVYVYDIMRNKVRIYKNVGEAVKSNRNNLNIIITHNGKRVRFKDMGEFVLYVDNFSGRVKKVGIQ